MNWDLFIAMALLPIVWMALTKFVFNPLSRLAKKHCSENVAEFLTRERFNGS